MAKKAEKRIVTYNLAIGVSVHSSQCHVFAVFRQVAHLHAVMIIKSIRSNT